MLFRSAWAEARGFFRTAHAGEEGPAAYVVSALDTLHVHRIDHGNRALEDPALVARLASLGIGLTVCPLSNLRLCGVPSLDVHPLHRMLDAGLRATINSDDPAYFGGYCLENWVQVFAALDLDEGHARVLAANSVAASLLHDSDKAVIHSRIAAW